MPASQHRRRQAMTRWHMNEVFHNKGELWTQRKFPDATFCQICWQNYRKTSLAWMFPCGHAYHADCADHYRWAAGLDACPWCRAPLGN